MNKTVINTELAPKAVGAYSQGIAITANKLHFFSGQIGINPLTNALVGNTVSEQTEQILKNIAGLLSSQKLTTENIVKTTIFLTDMSNFKEVNALYAQFIGSNAPPARSCVAVSAIPLGALVEIEIIACC